MFQNDEVGLLPTILGGVTTPQIRRQPIVAVFEVVPLAGVCRLLCGCGAVMVPGFCMLRANRFRPPPQLQSRVPMAH